MAVFRDFSAIMILHHRPMIMLPARGIGEVLNIVPYSDYQLICDKTFVYKIHGKSVRHLPQHKPGFVCS